MENMQLRQRIREALVRSRQTYGSPRLAQMLGCPGRRDPHCPYHARRAHLRHVSVPSIAWLPPTAATVGRSRRTGFKTIALKRPNQVWTTDATCILTAQGWLYLVAVLDVFTRRVIGWAMHQILDAQLVIAALQMALTQRRPGQSLIIHSDRGAHFASAAYRQVLTQHRLLPSMSRKGNCYDNAFIESFWSTLKYELVYHHRFATLAAARTTRRSITSRPFITAPDCTPVLTIKVQSILNPN